MTEPFCGPKLVDQRKRFNFVAKEERERNEELSVLIAIAMELLGLGKEIAWFLRAIVAVCCCCLVWCYWFAFR